MVLIQNNIVFTCFRVNENDYIIDCFKVAKIIMMVQYRDD